jgi:pimeloyl-ACP methyl ester carboxylesterase
VRKSVAASVSSSAPTCPGYTLVGSGPTKVVVLHGWFGDWSVFEPLLYALDHDRFTYAFMDFRGYGSSKLLRGEHSIAEIAGDAVALADSLGWVTFDVVGHSLGGMALQWILAEHPGRVRRAVAITPVPATGVPLPPEVYAMYRNAAGDAAQMGAFMHQSVGGRYSLAWQRAMGEACVQTTTPEAWIGYLDALVSPSFADRIAGSSARVKIVVGAHDAVITEPMIRATMCQWLPNAELEVLPDCGHYPMMESPIHTAAVVEEYLSREP